MKKNNTITFNLLVIIGILLVVNILSDSFFFRIDLTEDSRYTLSQATKDILRNLDEPVTVTAYFSEDLPADVAKARRDFKELLIEYVNLSKGMLDYEFIDPTKNEETEKEVMQQGIQPIIINVREKDQNVQKKAYLGAVVQLGERKEIIPVLLPEGPIEYSLSTSIKKLSVTDKPLIGFVQGHGEPSLNMCMQVSQQLSVMYNVEEVDLSTSNNDLNKYKTIIFLRPTDTVPPPHLAQLDKYLSEGGNMFIALNTVNFDFTTAQGNVVYTGVAEWLEQKGLKVDNNFVIDGIKCGTVSVQQQQMGMTFNTQIQFPYIPIIYNFSEHTITKGLEAIVLPMVSSVQYQGDTTAIFTPLLKTSEQSGMQTPPLYFDVNKRWMQNDFPVSNITVAGVLTGKFGGNKKSSIVIVGDGDFPVNGEGRGAQQLQPDNLNFIVNSIDWLSDDTGLIELRTKGVTARPLDEIDDSKKMFLKWLNTVLPILLVIIYGFIRWQRNRNIRIKRMEEGYV
ncbi:MAG: Gldg family protein [Saprospiraceae bacterium]|nr:Gldg family protein [Saprospiraceae bacterium]